MRSVIAFMACTGFIVWAHSCEKRIVGVKTYAQQAEPDNAENQFSFNGLSYERPLLLAHIQTPVALDALFVNVHYEQIPETDWKR
jgi:hypothetical protein